jgi:hypothetical protein
MFKNRGFLYISLLSYIQNGTFLSLLLKITQKHDKSHVLIHTSYISLHSNQNQIINLKLKIMEPTLFIFAGFAVYLLYKLAVVGKLFISERS